MSKIKIIGVPIDLGANRRGVDMGPSAMRIAQLGPRLKALGHEVVDGGNVPVPIAEAIEPGDERCKYKNEIREFSMHLKQATYQALKEEYTPLILGGDHSISMGSVAGISKFYKERNQSIGLIWFDAHGDINTPNTSPTGNVHGMPVAHILGLGDPVLKSIADFLPMVQPQNVVMIGLRDLDEGEKSIIKSQGIKAYTMSDLDQSSLYSIMEEAIAIASKNTAGFHVSFDMDWLDPAVAPGVGTAVSGGGTYREGHLAMECMAQSEKIISLEVTEVNPIFDIQSRTANSAVEMILSGFGKRIL